MEQRVPLRPHGSGCWTCPPIIRQDTGEACPGEALHKATITTFVYLQSPVEPKAPTSGMCYFPCGTARPCRGRPLPRALLGCNILPRGCAPHRRRDSPQRLPQDTGGSQWGTPIVIITSTPIFYSNSLRLFSPEAKLFKPATLSYPDAGINSALGVRLLFERTVDSPSNSGFTHGVNPLLRPYL